MRDRLGLRVRLRLVRLLPARVEVGLLVRLRQLPLGRGSRCAPRHPRSRHARWSPRGGVSAALRTFARSKCWSWSAWVSSWARVHAWRRRSRPSPAPCTRLRLRVVVRQDIGGADVVGRVEEVDVLSDQSHRAQLALGPRQVGLVGRRELGPIGALLLGERRLGQRSRTVDRMVELQVAELLHLLGDRLDLRVPARGRGRRRGRRARKERRPRTRTPAARQRRCAGSFDAPSRDHARSNLAAARSTGRSRSARYAASPAYDARDDEGSDPVRRRRHPPSPDHAHEREAARARGQQADPLLRHRRHGRSRDQGDRHHRGRHRRRDQGGGRRRLPLGRRHHVHPSGRAARTRPLRPDRPRLPR